MDNLQALHNFWSSFGLKAYDETTVPDDAIDTLGHYITYSVSTAHFDEPIALSANLWYKSTSWADITNKEQEISERIGNGGVTIPFQDGIIWITRGVPFSRRMPSEGADSSNIRRIYLNIQAEFISAG